MIRFTAGFLLLLLLATATMVFGAERPVNLPAIRTLEELVGQPPIKLDGGWQVQLGVGDGGKAAGPWRLVYCLAKHVDADQELSAIWRPSANVKLAAPRGGTPLPGRIPVEPPWSNPMRQRVTLQKDGQPPPPLLRLSLRGDTFEIESDVPMVAWPDMHLLARWWVNGKPVIPARTDRIEAISIGRTLRYTEHLKIAFRLPDNLGPLEPGDQVGVQVLYSPAFVKMLPKSRAGEGLRLASLSDRSVRATVPLLSNRIEIPVTSGMLNNESQEGRSQ